MKTTSVFIGLLLLCFYSSGLLQAQQDSLFQKNIFSHLQQYSPLEIVIETDLRNLKSDRHAEEWQAGTFQIMMGDSVAYEQPVSIATRGNMRKKICDFPPVKIRFYQGAPEEDSLADINELKMVVSCRNSTEDEQLVMREYLAYELYNLVTEESFRVKSATVRFRRPGRKNASKEGTAFFIESEEEMAARIGGKPLKPRIISPKIMDSLAYTRMCVFQYMIGNTDWGAYSRHNMKVVGFPDRRIIAVPYDFDYSGLVDANYAAPTKDLPIENVRERCYLGLCHSPQLYQSVFDEYLAVKDQMLALCENYSGLSHGSRKDAAYYLSQFFEILENPDKAKKEIVEDCNRRVKKD